jgi:o-succinylbenzoate synthase
VGSDLTGNHLDSNDSAINDSAINDSAINDSAINDSAINDSAINDSAINDSAINDSAAGNLLRAWADIGSGGRATLDAVDLWLVELGFIQPVETAQGVHRSRPVVVVRLRGHDGDLPVEGWGEGAALADTTYDREDVALSWATLKSSLIPALMDLAAGDGGRLARPSRLGAVRRAAPTAPLSFAAIEMAVADFHLRAERRTLAQVLGVEGRSVPIGAVVGRIEPLSALVEQVIGLRGQGFSRVKVKIGPGWDLEPLEAIRRSLPDRAVLALQADANGAYSAGDLGHLATLDRFDLLCLEQPFDRNDLATHRLLAHRITTPICLDESIDSPESAREALATGASSVICIKPSRLGGLGATLDLVESCTRSGVPLWMGGMFESGYARGVNTTLAALPGFAWPGDLSPATSYLEHDLATGADPERTGPDRVLSALPPLSGGLGGPPDVGILEQYGVKHRTFDVGAK